MHGQNHIKNQAVSYFETSILKRQTQRCYKPQDSNPYRHRSFNLNHEKN